METVVIKKKDQSLISSSKNAKNQPISPFKKLEKIDTIKAQTNKDTQEVLFIKKKDSKYDIIKKAAELILNDLEKIVDPNYSKKVAELSSYDSKKSIYPAFVNSNVGGHPSKFVSFVFAVDWQKDRPLFVSIPKEQLPKTDILGLYNNWAYVSVSSQGDKKFVWKLVDQREYLLQELNIHMNKNIFYLSKWSTKPLEGKIVWYSRDEVSRDPEVIFQPKKGLKFSIKLSTLEAGVKRAILFNAPRFNNSSKKVIYDGTKKTSKNSFDWRVKWWDWEKVILK